MGSFYIYFTYIFQIFYMDIYYLYNPEILLLFWFKQFQKGFFSNYNVGSTSMKYAFYCIWEDGRTIKSLMKPLRNLEGSKSKDYKPKKNAQSCTSSKRKVGAREID